MCHFITATLSGWQDVDPLREVIERHGLRFEPLRNDVLAAQLRPSESCYRATGFMCDCGTGLGSGRRPGRPIPLDAQVHKLRRRGWGEAKIGRWIEQQERNRKNAARKRQGKRETPSAEEWQRFLTEALSSAPVPWIGLLLHWYSGSLEDEEIALRRRQVVPLASLSAELLLDVEEDVLYEFRAG